MQLNSGSGILGAKMVRLRWRPFVRTRGMAALVAAFVVVLCLSAGAHAAGSEDACATSDSLPRFCAQSGMVDHLFVVTPPVIPAASGPEAGLWLPVARSEHPGFRPYVAASAPRAPPSLLV